MLKEENERFYRYDDKVKIYYEIHGNAKNVLLCIHGYGSSHESWYDILPYLVDYFTLILIDLKGFGLSSKPNDSKYGVNDQAEIILSLIESLKLRKIFAVGQSYGAVIVLAAYLKANNFNKDYFEKLILCDATLFIDDLPMLKFRMREPILKRIIIRTVPAKIIAKISLRRMFFDKSKINETRIERYAKYIRLPGTKISFIRTALLMYRDIRNFILPNLEKINIPVLVIWGENDPLTPLEHATLLNEIIKKSSLRIIQKCGHVPHEEKPEEAADTITKFLKD